MGDHFCHLSSMTDQSFDRLNKLAPEGGNLTPEGTYHTHDAHLMENFGGRRHGGRRYGGYGGGYRRSSYGGYGGYGGYGYGGYGWGYPYWDYAAPTVVLAAAASEPEPKPQSGFDFNSLGWILLVAVLLLFIFKRK